MLEGADFAGPIDTCARGELFDEIRPVAQSPKAQEPADRCTKALERWLEVKDDACA
jgi:hypothetical protein